jgi:rSAM/selenodomain-associated transferase 2/rSAM/selenodomain-associated transferase 1
LGIVIPTLDEAGPLPPLLRDLQELRIPKRIVVVDGGSVDGTPTLASAGGARVISAPAGRGGQLRAGVEFLRAPWLLLLHADSRVPPEVCRALEAWLLRADPHQVGYFRFRIEEAGVRWRLLEQGQRLRERAFGLVFGDQGLVVHRSRLSQVGGVPDLPVMEDVELVRRLRRHGPVVAIPAPLPTSARRYRREGPLAVLRNALLLGLHHLGVPAARLSRWYPREPRLSGNTPGRRCLLVFARAPVQGRVKTRLAAGIGEEAALEVYRTLGRRVVDQVRRGPWLTRILHDPPGEEVLVAEWLGADGVELGPQSDGDLGARMSRAMEGAWRSGAGPVCLIGTDAPDVDQPLVEEAFTALEQGADVVFGPAEDGGYYLIGLRSPAPGLFRTIPWSTDRVLSVSLDRCREAGLEALLLRTLRDVDTEEDLLASALLLRNGRG